MSISVSRSFSVFILTLAALACASGVLAALAGASGAVAGEKPVSLDPIVTVHFDDLNISTAAGSRILYARISAAAQAVCSQGADWYPSQHWAQQDCFRATLDRAVTKLNIPAVTALHLNKTHRHMFAAR